MSAGKVEPVLSGEFTVKPEGAWFVAHVVGNEEEADMGDGRGRYPEQALELAWRDYLLSVGPGRLTASAP